MNNPISPKVTLPAIAGAVVTLVVWLLELAGIDMPVGPQGALIVLVMVLVAYWVPDPLRDALRAIEELSGVDEVDEEHEVNGG